MADEEFMTAVVVCCAICVAICTAISVFIYRQLRATDLVKSIAEGDTSVRAHVDQQIAAIAATVTRIEHHQESEDRHVLRAKDLGPLHDKINRVSEGLAAIQAQSQAENKGLSEQLKVVQQMLMTNDRGSRT